MYVRIELLKKKQIDHIVSQLESVEMVDGRHSAGHLLTGIKDNRELPPGIVRSELGISLKAALLGNDEFKSFALPRAIAVPEFVRYDAGMSFGLHTDAALFNPHSSNTFRTDLAVTVFLSDPNTYDGGELIVHIGAAEVAFKFKAGDAVVYPAEYLHRVLPVTRGTRLAVVTWVQSYVRCHAGRQTLHDLNRLANNCAGDTSRSDSIAMIGNIYNRLLRMWAEV